MEFEKISIEDFNNRQGTELQANMTFHEVTEELDASLVSYFYVSLSADDVTEAIKEEQQIADMLGGLCLQEIDELGIYIATY